MESSLFVSKEHCMIHWLSGIGVESSLFVRARALVGAGLASVWCLVCAETGENGGGLASARGSGARGHGDRSGERGGEGEVSLSELEQRLKGITEQVRAVLRLLRGGFWWRRGGGAGDTPAGVDEGQQSLAQGFDLADALVVLGDGIGDCSLEREKPGLDVAAGVRRECVVLAPERVELELEGVVLALEGLDAALMVVRVEIVECIHAGCEALHVVERAGGGVIVPRDAEQAAEAAARALAVHDGEVARGAAEDDRGLHGLDRVLGRRAARFESDVNKATVDAPAEALEHRHGGFLHEGRANELDRPLRRELDREQQLVDSRERHFVFVVQACFEGGQVLRADVHAAEELLVGGVSLDGCLGA